MADLLEHRQQLKQHLRAKLESGESGEGSAGDSDEAPGEERPEASETELKLQGQ